MPLVVAIVGRPNVGKSTLFNRLVGRRHAIVDDRPGVTRDRREGEGRIADLRFTVVDTAGLDDVRGAGVEALMQEQTARAVAAADVTLLLIDARAGITPLDRQFADRLRRGSTPVILVANKCEGRLGEGGRLESYGLGLGEPIPLSAEHGEGFADLYDALQPYADRAAGDRGEPASELNVGGPEAIPAAAPIRLAVTGRPNVGKSTLVNRLLGDDRLVTSPEPGTTRDAITVDWTWGGRAYRLVDTAGLRRRSKVEDRLEQLAAADTWQAIRFAQVVVVLIDADVGLDKQDLTIARTVVDEGRAPVLAVNKIDRVDDPRRIVAAVRERLDESLAQVRGLRVAAVSALTGTGLDDLMSAVTSTFEVWTHRIATPPLNRWLAAAVARHPPPVVRGRRLKLRYVTQTAQRPPTFTVFAGGGEDLPEEYVRYLVNDLRDAFALPGVPIRLVVRSARNPFAPRPSGVKGR